MRAPPYDGQFIADAPISRQQGLCLDLVCKGQSNKEIARTLSLSAQTVKNHMTLSMLKLRAHNRTHAALLWLSIRDRYAALWAVDGLGTSLPPLDLPCAVPPDMPATPVDRFWLLVDKRDNGCWDWRGPLHRGGYDEPQCNLKGLENLGRSARRVAYALLNGKKLPTEIHIRRDLARCPSPSCVQPDHMSLWGVGQHPEWKPFLFGKDYERYLQHS